MCSDLIAQLGPTHRDLGMGMRHSQMNIYAKLGWKAHLHIHIIIILLCYLESYAMNNSVRKAPISKDKNGYHVSTVSNTLHKLLASQFIYIF